MRATAAAILFGLLATPSAAQDMLIRGGMIYTGDADNPTAEVVVVDDRRRISQRSRPRFR